MSEQPLAHGHAGVGVKNQVLQKAYLLLAFSFIPCGIGAVVGAKFNPMAVLGGGWVGIIAFFAIFSDLGIGPAVIQHKDLDRHDLGGIFSLSVWSGAVMALLFFAAAGTIASLYGDSQVLRNVLRILALNLFFAAANIVPNALILKEKRFRFAAMRSLTVQIAGGTAAIAAAYAGAGIYALTINPVFSSLMLLAINYRQNPLPLRLRPGRKALGKVFSFSAYQFSFQLINYFSRNLDKLLMGRYMSLSQLGYYDKSYRLMMLPLQNIAYVISPVMHPIFSEMQHDLKQLGASYLDADSFPLPRGFRDYKKQPTDTGSNRENADRTDKRLSFKLGLTPNATDEYAIGYVRQEGEKGNPVYTGQSTQKNAVRYWRWPYWDKDSLYFLSSTRLGELPMMPNIRFRVAI